MSRLKWISPIFDFDLWLPVVVVVVIVCCVSLNRRTLSAKCFAWEFPFGTWTWTFDCAFYYVIFSFCSFSFLNTRTGPTIIQNEWTEQWDVLVCGGRCRTIACPRALNCYFICKRLKWSSRWILTCALRTPHTERRSERINFILEFMFSSWNGD